MTVQALGVSERGDVVRVSSELGLSVLDDVLPPDEVGGGQGRPEPRRARGRQRVVRPREIVADRHRRVLSDEDGSGAGHARDGPSRIDADELEVLGRQLVGKGERLCQVASHDRRTARREGLAGDRGRLGVVREQGDDGVREPRAGGDQHCERERIVLGLRDQIDGDQPRVGALVRDDCHLGRPCQRVDAHLARELLLRFGHERVARPDDDVRARDLLRADRERRDRLCAAGPEDSRRAGDARGCSDLGQHRAVPARRRRHDHVAHAGEPRHRRRHDHRARIRRTAARHVAGRSPEREREAAHRAACVQRLLVVERNLRRVESADARGGLLERSAHRQRALRCQLVPRDGAEEGIAEPRAVELLRQRPHCFVSAGAHVRDDRRDRGGHVGGHRRGGAQRERVLALLRHREIENADHPRASRRSRSGRSFSSLSR